MHLLLSNETFVTVISTAYRSSIVNRYANLLFYFQPQARQLLQAAITELILSPSGLGLFHNFKLSVVWSSLHFEHRDYFHIKTKKFTMQKSDCRSSQCCIIYFQHMMIHLYTWEALGLFVIWLVIT